MWLPSPRFDPGPTRQLNRKVLRVSLTPMIGRPKLHKYPNGYPGDAEAEEDEPTTPMHPVKAREYKKVRMIVKWHCHGCDAIFAYGSKICASCEHERCRECRRVP